MWPGEGRGRFQAPFKCYIQLLLCLASFHLSLFTLSLFPSVSSFPLYLSPLKQLKGTEYTDRKRIYLQIQNGDGCGDVGYSSRI